MSHLGSGSKRRTAKSALGAYQLIRTLKPDRKLTFSTAC